MAREVVAFIWCDPCQAREIQEPGEEFTIHIGTSGKAKVIALCERDRKEFLDPLEELLAQAPTVDAAGDMRPKVKKRERSGAPMGEGPNDPTPCLICDPAGGVTMKNPNSLSAHLRTSHQMNLPKYQATVLGDESVPREACGIGGCKELLYGPRIEATRRAHAKEAHPGK